jgi:hypothetical protein
MSDIAELTDNAEPRPLTLKVKGVTYSVLPFNMIQVGRIQKAIKLLPCPHNTRRTRKAMSEQLARGECTEDELKAAVGRSAELEEKWPPRLMEDPEAQDLLYFEGSVQVAMVRSALKLPDDATALSVLEAMKPVDYLTMVLFCFQVAAPESADGPKANGEVPSTNGNGSITTNISATSSPAPDGPESTSSPSPSPSSSAMLG